MQELDHSYYCSMIKKMLFNLNIYEDFTTENMIGGRNNRLFKITTDHGSFCAKFYFLSRSNQRNRGKIEYNFMKNLWDLGVRSIPKPLIFFESEHCALYEFIEGKKIKSEDISIMHIEYFLNFYFEINSKIKYSGQSPLPSASEACFSIQDHFHIIDSRLKKLKTINKTSDLDEKAAIFIHRSLCSKWAEIKQIILDQIKTHSIDFEYQLKDHEKRLSPSDFGFHNAIILNNGCIKFIDFEYAGWDDPAKFVCDFFCQPNIALDLDYFSYFAKSVSKDLPNPKKEFIRFHILFPLFRLKWCCIILNEFIDSSANRRSFALANTNINLLKEIQLKKAVLYLNNIDLDIHKLNSKSENEIH